MTARETITFKLDGRDVSAVPGEPLIEVAKREGIEIPHLCYKPGLEEVGNCRACVVEIGGERVLAPSCCRNPSNGMKVTTDSERALKSQKMVLELLLADMPEREFTRHNEVDRWAAKLAVGKPRFEARARAVAVHLHASRGVAAAGRGQHALALHFHHAGAAVAHAVEPGLVAKARDLHAFALGDLDQRLIDSA